jgi:hypothetical protein
MKATGQENESDSGYLKKSAGFVWKYFYAFFLYLYVFTAGFVFRENRDILSGIIQNFKDRKKKKDRQPHLLPDVDLSYFLKNDAPIRILEPVHAKGDTSLLELCYISQMVKAYNPLRMFEMGTFDGRTTLNLAANSREEAVIYTLDLPREKLSATALKLDERDVCLVDKDQPGIRFRNTRESKKIVQLLGDTGTFDFSPYENTMDLVFIDASHAYDYVLNDTRIALKLLRQGKGVILWHDYGDAFDGVTKALNELYSKGAPYKNMRHLRETTLVVLTTGVPTT